MIITKLYYMSMDVQPVANARICAAVVKRNKIVGLGVNTYKTHPIAKKLHNLAGKECLHAEMNAILQAKNSIGDLTGCAIYVARSRKIKYHYNNRSYYDWQYGNAKPCAACATFIKEHGIKKVYYTE